MEHDVVRVSGDKEHLGARAHPQQAVGKLAAVHLGHDHVTDDQVNRAGFAGQLQCFRAAASAEDGITDRGQKLSVDIEQVGFILHQQDVAGAFLDLLASAVSLGCFKVANGAQKNIDLGPFARLGFNRDLSQILLHNSIHRGQTQAGAPSQALGGVEGFKRMETRLFVHAHACVADMDGEILADADAARGQEHRTKDILGFDEQLATVGHGITRVDHDVEDNLLEVGLVHHHRTAGAQVHHQLHVFSNQTGQDAGQIPEGMVRL